MSSVDPVFDRKLRQVLELWIKGVEKGLKRAQIRGYLRKSVNLRHLAEFIVMTHEGAYGMVKSMKDRKVFKSPHAQLRDYLQSLS